MAKKLHPLDVRYKGPSTAFTGKSRATRTGPADPVARSDERLVPATPPPPPLPNTSPTAPVASPWGTLDPPPPHPALPPLPVPKRKPKSRRSVIRVLIGLAIMGLIVGGNIIATRGYNGALFDLQTEINAVDL